MSESRPAEGSTSLRLTLALEQLCCNLRENTRVLGHLHAAQQDGGQKEGEVENVCV